MAWSGLNRRQFPRVVYPCMVKFTSDDDKKSVLLAHTENIGEGGACIIVKKEIRLFTAIDVEIDLVDADEHLFLKGKVVWSVRRKANEQIKPMFYDIGIEFVDVPLRSQERLKETVNHLIKKGAAVLKPIY